MTHLIRNGLLIMAMLLMAFVQAAWADEAASLAQENRLLQAELTLAGKPHIYFLVDLGASKLYFKSRGIVLKEIDILGTRTWGHAPAIEPLELVQKSALFKPKRENITPTQELAQGSMGSVSPATNATTDTSKPFDIKALELKDMPTTYSIKLGDKLYLVVRPQAEGGARTKAISLAQKLGWYFYMPAMSIWKAAKKEPTHAVEITLAPKDAQALYWSFLDGDSAIVYLPKK